MRISDWSPDVCSSYLRDQGAPLIGAALRHALDAFASRRAGRRHRHRRSSWANGIAMAGGCSDRMADAAWLPRYAQPDRKSVVLGKSVSVRVDLGGRRVIKKKI